MLGFEWSVTPPRFGHDCRSSQIPHSISKEASSSSFFLDQQVQAGKRREPMDFRRPTIKLLRILHLKQHIMSDTSRICKAQFYRCSATSHDRPVSPCAWNSSGTWHDLEGRIEDLSSSLPSLTTINSILQVDLNSSHGSPLAALIFSCAWDNWPITSPRAICPSPIKVFGRVILKI